MNVLIKSIDKSYSARFISMQNDILHANVTLKKGGSWLPNIKKFYEMHDLNSICVINKIEREIKTISYNSICDYKEHQEIDITIVF